KNEGACYATCERVYPILFSTVVSQPSTLCVCRYSQADTTHLGEERRRAPGLETYRGCGGLAGPTRSVHIKSRPTEWWFIAFGLWDGGPAAWRKNRDSQTPRFGRSPISTERNGKGDFGRRGERSAWWCHCLRPSQYMDFR